MVRISFGAYNTMADIDALAGMVERITRDDYQGQYYQTPENGDYRVAGDEDALLGGFSLTGGRHDRNMLVAP